MNSDNKLLFYVAIFAVLTSLAGVAITYNSISNTRNFITGFATEEGVVNLTVTTQALIEIYSAGGVAGQKNISWGSGIVDTSGGNTLAILATNGTVQGGTWDPISEGFLIRNIGNVNVTLGIHASQTANAFIGGSSPQFRYNLSNFEANSCTTFAGGVQNTYVDFQGTSQPACTNFRFNEANDELRLDILLRIPSDSLTGARSSTVVLTYSGV